MEEDGKLTPTDQKSHLKKIIHTGETGEMRAVFVRVSCFGLHGRLKVLIPLWDHTQALTALTLPWKRLAEHKDAL